MASEPSASGIEITPRWVISFLAFLANIWPPVFVVDGQETRGRWEQPTHIPVAPGTHRVRAFYRYYWFLPANAAEQDVQVPAGGCRITYKARWFFFLSGTLTVG